MAGALTDSAIDDCILLGADVALLEIDLCQFRGWLERGIIVGGRLPRHALRPGNMAAAEHAFLRILGHVRDFPRYSPGERTSISGLPFLLCPSASSKNARISL